MSSTVFTNFDLLEDILLHLPLQDLLLSKRVCKQFENVQQKSDRVRKALFLQPFNKQKVYYPNCSNPTWYLVPNRVELALEGFIDGIDPDEPVMAPRKYTSANSPTTSTSGETDPEGELGLFCSGSGSGCSDGSASSKITVVNNVQHVRSAKQKNAFGSSLLYDPDAVNPFRHGANSEARTPRQRQASRERFNVYNRLPRGPPKDNKMLVSRIGSGPFLNPFAELFFERFWRGARGTWHAVPNDYYPPGCIPLNLRDFELIPPRRYKDGTIHNRSHRTHAVQRFIASWRQMVPFSADTTSIEIECFDFGPQQIWDDEGLTAGSMMEQLGKHWGDHCPDCCIFDFWFAEFVQPYCYTDQSYMNRGEHGVRKLRLDSTGWDALAQMYEAGLIEATGVKDRIRPY